MTEHTVHIKAPRLELGNSDIVLRVRNGGRVVGTLKISKGNLVWKPRDRQRGYRENWEEFDKFIQDSGRRLVWG